MSTSCNPRAKLTSTAMMLAATLLVGCGLFAPVIHAASAPPAAAEVGYTVNSFSSTFSTATVDLKNTKNRGYQWYLWDLFGNTADPNAVVLNGDGTATLLGTTVAQYGQLVTAVQYTATNSFVGSGFGGGAYIEAELKFDPKQVAAAANVNNWPAFWALQIEGNITPGAAQWIGQESGYVHSLEADFFEAGHYSPQTPKTGYGGSLHDWYGIANKTCNPGLCQADMPWGTALRLAPVATDYTQFHRYGFLWVPATQTSLGYAEYFFDGEQMGVATKWQLFTGQAPPAIGRPWAFGILDQRHMFLILGTGKSQPLTVRSVNVWQGGTSGNMVN
jgi:hypothetical protein